MKAYKTVKRIISAAVALVTVLAVVPMLAYGAKVERPEILSSQSALLYCMESDTVLFSHNSEEETRPGTLIKLMVAVVALEEMENKGMTLDSSFTASSKAIRDTRGKHIGMKNGEIFALRDLISVMLHADADDAAHVIAEEFSDTYDNYIELMNTKATDLGMNNTKYFSVTGTEDEESYTTAADQMLLASYAIKIPALAELADQIRAVVPKTNKSNARYYGTSNYLLSSRVNPDYYYSGATGLLCGTQAEAGFCGILTSRKDGRNYIAVVTGAKNSRVLVSEEHEETDENGNTVTVPAVYKTVYNGLNEAKTLLIYGESRFNYIKAVNTATPITDIPVKLASGTDRVALMPQFDLEIFVSDDADVENEVTYKYVLNTETLTAPVKAGQVVGTLYVMYGGKSIGEVPLVTKNNIERDGWLMILDRLKELAATPFFTVLIMLTAFTAVFYIISTAVTRQRRLAEKKREAERGRRYLPSGGDEGKDGNGK